jgi:hypothetical protein
VKPPFFIWKSGTLDVCDSLLDLNERYPSTELAQEEVVVCDSCGQALWISRPSDGEWVNAAADPQPPSQELLRSILWKYLEGRGVPPEKIESLSLSELVAEVCPPDPYPAEKVKAKILWRLFIIVVGFLLFGVSVLIRWLRGDG